MKRILALSTILLALSLLFSCVKPTELSVSQSTLSFDNAGGSQTITVTANKVWTVSSDQGWIKVSPYSGEGTASVSIKCDENTSYDTRTGSITFISEELAATISVNQAEAKGLNVAKTDYEVSNEAQQLEVKVNANFNYSVNTDASWISYIGTKALKETTATFQIAENDGGERIGTVVLSGEGLTMEIRIKQATAQFVKFEDANFKAYCIKNFDKNGDGEISVVEARKVVTINVNTERIASLKGVEYFSNLDSLTCCPAFTGSSWSSSDRVWHLMDDDNNEVIGILSAIDLSHNDRLSYFCCSGNQLSSLDLSNNKALCFFDCSYNLLSTLDVSNNTALTYLYCNYNNLTNLDVTKLHAIERLEFTHNRLVSIDISSNNKLTDLDCTSNYIYALDVSNNTELVVLHCSFNQLTALDVSMLPSLWRLRCSWNQLSSLDVSHNPSLKYLVCDSNLLSSLDVSHNPVLSSIRCTYNALERLDVSNNPELRELQCQSNPMLIDIWLKEGQVIANLIYDTYRATIQYK